MRKIVYFFWLPFALMLQSYATSPDSSNYIYLKTGDYVFGDVIRVDKEHAGSVFSRKETNVIYLDNQRYDAARVRFFIRENYRYAVVQDLSRGNEPDFAVMTQKGRLNLYESKIVQEHGHIEVDRQFYYNRGMGPVQRATYRNLMNEYGNHTPALEYLQKSRRMQYGYVGLGGFAVLYTVGSMAHYFTNYVFAVDPPLDGQFFLINLPLNTLVNIGFNTTLILGSGLLAHVFRRQKDKNLLLSVYAYNRITDY